MEKLPITSTGYTKLEAELKHLKTIERPAVIEDIAEAREHGDLKENAEYHAAREKQGFIEGRIQELEHKFALAEVIDPSTLSGPRVVFGAMVDLVDCDTDDEVTYQIVGEYESNLANGKISLTSPLARGLIGKEEGDIAEVHTPGGTRSFEIVEVHYI